MAETQAEVASTLGPPSATAPRVGAKAKLKAPGPAASLRLLTSTTKTFAASAGCRGEMRVARAIRPVMRGARLEEGCMGVVGWRREVKSR